MARGYQKTIIVGNLGGEPEVKSFDSGNTVATFSVAVTENYKNRDGEKVQETEWYRTVVWGNLAEICERYLRKGSSVLIEGKMKTRKYTDRNGDEKSITELVAANLTMLGDGDSQSKDSGRDAKRDANQPQRDANTEAEQEDDLPF